MTTTTIFSDTADGRIEGSSSTYTTARSTATGSADASTTGEIGQRGLGGAFFYCWEGFFWFATGTIADTDVVSSATFSLYGSADNSDVDFTLTAALSNWGDTLSTADWVAGASLSALTTVATFATSGTFSTSAYNDFTDVALPANIDKTGNTRLLVYSSRHSSGTSPGSSNEYVVPFFADTAGTGSDPKLVVVHTSSVSATATPAAIVTTVTVPAVTVSLSKTVTQTAIAATASLPAATKIANSTVTPAVIATSVTLPTASVTAGADRTPNTIAATVTVPQATPRDGTVLTVYADATNTGRVYGADATYATARSTPVTSSVDGLVGQVYVGATYFCDELFLEFDTSAIPDGATITSAVLSLYGKTNEIGTAFNVIAALRDYGSTLETGDYVAGASLSGLTTVASFASSGFTTSGYNDFADVALPANVNKTGTTRLILYSDRQASGTPPTGFERIEFFLSNEAGTFKDPQLVVVYTDAVPATVTPTATVATVAVPQATAQQGTDATPAAITTTVATPAPTVLAAATVTPAAITATVTVPAATSATGADRTPDTITATVAVPAPTVNAAATVTPAVIVTSVTVPQADPIESSPVPINAVVTIPQVSVSTGWTATPAVIATTVAVPAATAAQGADRTPAVIATTAALPAVTVNAAATVTPATITATVALPAAAAGTATVVTPAAIATTVTVPAVTVNAGATVTPATIAATAALPAATAQQGAGTAPAVIATTVTVPAASVTAGATVTPGTIAATATVPQVVAQQGTTVTPPTVATVATLPSGSVLASWTATPDYIAAVVSVGAAVAGTVNEWGHSVPTVTGQARSSPTTGGVRSVPTVKQMATSSSEVK